MRKKFLYIFLAGTAIFLTACGAKNDPGENVSVKEVSSEAEEKAESPKWLNNFYNGKYEYRKSTVKFQNGEEQIVSVMEGKCIVSPYKEYVRIIEPEGGAWPEAYYYEEGEDTAVLLKTESGYVTQKSNRSYPYGFGQDLKFTKTRTETYDGVSCDVYETRYEVNLADQMNTQVGEEVITQPLSATVEQEYYVDTDKNQLLCIVTDLTELNEKTELGIMLMTGADYSEEEENGDGTNGQTKEKLEILSYDDSIVIETPSVD